jgi:membrane protease YdiL (CAAX protease family)
MNALSGQSTPWTRVLGITICIALAYVAGSVFADIFQGFGVSLFHFPGGINKIYTMAEPPGWSIAATLLGVWVGLLLGAWYIRRRGWVSSLRGLFHAKWSDLSYIPLGIAGQVGISLAYAPFHLGSKMDGPVKHLFGGAGGFLWLLGVMSILGAPIIEETVFRGMMYRGFYENFADRNERWAFRLALVISALLFAGAHFELLQLPGLFFVGLLLAYLVKKTGRLVPSIVTHASFNAVAFAVVTFAQHGKI